MAHKCPVPGGTAAVETAQLMCSRHWYTVPKTLRTALWRAWRNGQGMGSEAHVAAMRACIKAANAAIPCTGGRGDLIPEPGNAQATEFKWRDIVAEISDSAWEQSTLENM